MDISIFYKYKNSSKNIQERFFSFVEKTESCWNWTGSMRENGYGQFSLANKPIKAHRVSWLIFNGIIPTNKYILHKCDNRKCVRPDHLFVGTQKDNIADMICKKRGNFKTRKWNPLEIITKDINILVCTRFLMFARQQYIK